MKIYAIICTYYVMRAILWGVVMAISYDKLWKILIDKKMNKTQLKETAGISTNAVAKLGRNESVSLETLEKICKMLQCNIGDIVEFVSAD